MKRRTTAILAALVGCYGLGCATTSNQTDIEYLPGQTNPDGTLVMVRCSSTSKAVMFGAGGAKGIIWNDSCGVMEMNGEHRVETDLGELIGAAAKGAAAGASPLP